MDLANEALEAKQRAIDTRPLAPELSLRRTLPDTTATASAAAAAAALPTVVAASLGAPPVAAAGSASGASADGGAVSGLPIQALAERVFGILERRLIVERERRGIRS